MPEVTQLAVLGPDVFPDANRRVYARLKMLRADWPGRTFHVITTTTGAIATAALRAARKLRWGYSAVGEGQAIAPDRIIVYWDFECERTAAAIRMALVRDLPCEVWDSDDEPAGPAAADHVQGIA